jgi:hypothetical protein
MIVENYEYDPLRHNAFLNEPVWTQKNTTLPKRAAARLVREACSYFDGFAIDWSQYGEGQVKMHHDVTAIVGWENKVSGDWVQLTDIYFDRKTGAILQAGTQGGTLTL